MIGQLENKQCGRKMERDKMEHATKTCHIEKKGKN